MSLFFRQILILRHYVNYIEEKQDKSSIFLSSSVHTQAGVDIKILSGHSSSNVLLPRGGASIGGSALPQAVILIWWWRQRFHRRKWRFHNWTAFTIGGKWGRRSSSSSFKASNGEIRSKVKASLPVIENHSP